MTRLRYLLGALVVLALLAWMLRPERGATPKPPEPVATSLVASLLAAQANGAPFADEPALAAATPAPVDQGVICGGPSLPVDSNGSPDPAALVTATRFVEITEGVLAALRADAGDRANAAALVFEAAGAHPSGAAYVQNLCAGAEGCIAPAVPDQQSEAAERLVRLALLTSDPQVYAWALHSCRVIGRDAEPQGICSQLSVSQWARLDPQNATPWMAVLSTATARGDTALAEDALHHIATARRSDDGFGALPAQWLKHAPDTDADLPALWMALQLLGGIEAASLTPGYRPLMMMCRDGAMRDSSRQQTCAAAAEVLGEHADTLIGRSIGIRLGSRVGWPTDRVDQMLGEVSAFQMAVIADWKGTDQAPLGMGCAAVRSMLDRSRAVARLGEVGSLREWVSQSGKEPADFIETGRRQRRLREYEAAGAATAASAVAR